MNNLSRSEYWNNRFRARMEEMGFNTQQKFIDAFKKKHGLTLPQKTLSRWMHIYDPTISKEYGFPSFENMILIADVLDVDIGYLTGETDYKTFSSDKVCDFTGLNEQSLDVLVKTINTKSSSIMRKDFSDKTRIAINKLLSSDQFDSFALALKDLEEVADLYNQSQDKLIHASKDLSPHEKDFPPDADKEIDVQYGLSFQEKIALYELNNEFVFLINDTYPKHGI